MNIFNDDEKLFTRKELQAFGEFCRAEALKDVLCILNKHCHCINKEGMTLKIKELNQEQKKNG